MVGYEGKFVVPGEQEGQRLDRVLGLMLPGIGLRARRRLCDDGRVHIDGVSRKSAYKVRLAEEIVIVEAGEVEVDPRVRIIMEQGGLTAVYKPAGIHSAKLSGRENLNVEAMLPAMFPHANPVLLNRLDQPTSGLLLVGLNVEAVDEYHKAEREGRATKTYVALASGHVSGEEVITNCLDMKNCNRTRVLDEQEQDRTRWTKVVPIKWLEEKNSTLIRAVIHRGARHQIRAHLAHIGHPLVGDKKYKGPGEPGQIYLHHMRFEMADFKAEIAPPWSDTDLAIVPAYSKS